MRWLRVLWDRWRARCGGEPEDDLCSAEAQRAAIAARLAMLERQRAAMTRARQR